MRLYLLSPIDSFSQSSLSLLYNLSASSNILYSLTESVDLFQSLLGPLLSALNLDHLLSESRRFLGRWLLAGSAAPSSETEYRSETASVRVRVT